ncbi:CDH13 isoform 11 [Pongo abelii]|nr:CDH13 isoform 11 [Pongo abelii]
MQPRTPLVLCVLLSQSGGPVCKSQFQALPLAVQWL